MEDLQTLIRQCAANNRRGQEKLYLQFYPALFALCRKFFSDEHEALDALNDGMLKVYKNIGNYKDEGNFFNWVYTVVRNTALDKLKIKKQPLMHELKDDVQAAYENNPLQGLEWKEIYKLLDALQPATRAVCSLFYLESFSVKDISRQLDISDGTVKWHLSEARKKLKPVLKNYYS